LNIIFGINFDFRKDTKDPDVDKGSSTLRKYHQLLWTKTLPNGNYFCLSDLVENVYLFYRASEEEQYQLSSDSIIHTYSKWKRTEYLINQIPKEKIDEFLNIGYTIGGYIIFPSNKVNNLPSINQERGTNSQICDRFDITLECIRRFYIKEDSPLMETLKRYENFFNLFVNFKGYCEFFFLQDLTMENFTQINFFLPFTNFNQFPFPKTIEEYNLYKKNAIDFCKKRNKRIENYVNNLK